VTREETIRHLNELLRVCVDGEAGYRTAAEHVQNSELASVFTEYANQRGHCARQLHAEIERQGGTAEDSGTLQAAIHRGWMDVKSTVTGGDPGAIIAACETGEDAAQAAFEGVVDTDISGAARSLVETQRHKIQEALARLLRLKAEASAGIEYPKN
jgi:uncharacterized protein (TIGR02284 family)